LLQDELNENLQGLDMCIDTDIFEPIAQ